MPPGQRRVAFSAKAKKKQLQAKREDKRDGRSDDPFSEKRLFKQNLKT